MGKMFEMELRIRALSLEQVILGVELMKNELAHLVHLAQQGEIALPQQGEHTLENGTSVALSLTHEALEEEAGPSAEYTKVSLLDVPVPRRGGY